jgi:hypothetical protein
VTSRAEFLAQDRALIERMSEVRGHIEDMPGDERVFMLGALTGALERHLARAGEAEGPLNAPLKVSAGHDDGSSGAPRRGGTGMQRQRL